MELCGTEEEDISGFDTHTLFVRLVFLWELLVIRKLKSVVRLIL